MFIASHPIAVHPSGYVLFLSVPNSVFTSPFVMPRDASYSSACRQGHSEEVLASTGANDYAAGEFGMQNLSQDFAQPVPLLSAEL